jgi:hypothetical protein
VAACVPLLESDAGLVLCMLTYADVCGRMLTYAPPRCAALRERCGSGAVYRCIEP